MYEPIPVPSEDYITADLPLLGTIDAARFYKLELVVTLDMTTHEKAIYCLLREWQQTTAGRVVTLQQIIDAQQQQLERLAERTSAAEQAHAKLADLTASAVLLQADLADLQRQLAAKDAIVADLTAQLLSETTDPQPEPPPQLPLAPAPLAPPTPSDALPAPALESAPAYPCRYCSELLATKAGRAGHEWHRHGKRALDAEPILEIDPDPEPEPELPFRCPHCPRTFASAQAVRMHQMRAHVGQPVSVTPEPTAPEPTAPERPPIVVLELPPGHSFRCADCGSDAFSPSVRNPQICVRCIARVQVAA